MQFTAVEEIAAPIALVWRRVSNLDALEARVARRASDIARRPPGPAEKGTIWTCRAEMLGKTREITTRLERLEPESLMAATSEADGIEVGFRVELEPLGPKLTRLTVRTEAAARGLGARVILQSAKLAQQGMERRYKARVADFAASVEADAKAV